MPPSSAAFTFAGNTATNVAAARKPPNRRVRGTATERGRGELDGSTAEHPRARGTERAGNDRLVEAR